jgi:argonaute-like protein implicated in RNA metabolism and viral defense
MDDHEKYQIEKILNIVYKRKPKIPWAIIKWINWAKPTKVLLTNVEDIIAYNEYLRL